MLTVRWIIATILTMLVVHFVDGEDGASRALSADEPPGWALEFAQELEWLFATGNIAAAQATVDVRAFFDRAIKGLEPSAEELKQMWDSWQARFALFEQVHDALAGGGHYRLLRVRMVEDEPRALFRLVTSDHFVNYHDLLRERRGDSAHVTDMYAGSTAEWFSATSGRIMGMAMQGGPRAEEAMHRLLRFQRLLEQQKYEEALKDAWRRLPRRLREDKGVLINRLLAAQHTSDEEVRLTAYEFERLFPKDPALDLLMLDIWAIDGWIDEVLAALDRLRSWIGEDAWLEFMAGNAFYLVEQMDEAKTRFERAMQMKPDLMAPRWALVEVAIEEKDFETVAGQLTALLEGLGADIGDLLDLPFYAGFVASEEYEQWMARRGYTRALDADERSWLIESRLIGQGLFARYQMEIPADEQLSAAISTLIETWLKDEAGEKPEPWMVTRGLGSLFGDKAARCSGLEWKVAFTPQDGEFFVVACKEDRLKFDPFEAITEQLDGSPHQSPAQLEEITPRD